MDALSRIWSRDEKNHPCFRCGRTNLECEGVRNHRKQNNADSSDVNYKEEIEDLLKKQKKAKEAKINLSRNGEGRQITGANCSEI